MQDAKRVSVAKFMELTGLKAYTARNLTHIDGFPCVRLGRKIYIDYERALDWIKKNESNLVDLQERYVKHRRG